MRIKYLLCYLVISLIFDLGINAQPYNPPPYPYKHPKKWDKGIPIQKISPYKNVKPLTNLMVNENPFSPLIPEHQPWNQHLLPFQNPFQTSHTNRQNYPFPQNFNQPKSAFKKYYNNSPLGVREAWVHRYESGLLASTDIVADMAVDTKGNIYLTGTTTHPPYGMDICTIKFDADGNEIWRVYFDDGYQGYDEAWKIELDPKGNVVVIGKKTTDRGWGDIVIIKYNSEGVVQWYTQFKGELASYRPFNLAIDPYGNILLGGMVYDNHNGTDFLIIKYDADGELLWTAQYGLPGIWYEPSDLKSDQWGNIYITGSSHDFIANTLKYNPAGELLWEAQVFSGDHGWGYYPRLAISDSGYVYLITTVGDNNRGDIYTVKYNQDGQIIWWQKYNTSGDHAARIITLDLWGNIYVVGASYYHNAGLLKNVILKYDSHGNLQWEYIELPEINNLICDHDGNIYYIRQGSTLVRLHRDGWREWQRATGDTLSVSFRNLHPLLAVTPDNRICISGTRYSPETEEDYLTLNYNGQGQKVWSAHFNGDRNEKGYPELITLDHNGNIHVTARSYVSGSEQNLVTLTYSNSGELLRELRYEGDFSRYSYPHCKMVENGELITASSDLSTGGHQIICINRFNNEGQKIWEQYFGEVGNHSILHFNTDHSGNFYISGRQHTDSNRYFSLKYRAGGEQQWIIWHSPKEDHYYDHYNSFKVDETGNLYVVNYGFQSFIIQKFKPNGQIFWEKEIQYVNPYYFTLNFFVDQFENCYLSGYSIDEKLLFTFKLNKHGQLEWISADDVPGDRLYYVNGITVDGNSNIYITGSHYAESGEDIFTIKYNKDGQRLWINTLQNNDWTVGSLVFTDSKENVYTIGAKHTTLSDYDIIVIKYDSAGNERWVLTYGGTNTKSREYAKDAILDAYGNIYLTGASDLSSSFYSNYITTIKYEQTGEDIPPLPERLSILPNIPNPFNNRTIIRYELPRAGQVKLRVYDVLGQQVAARDLGYKNIGNQIYYYNANQLASGIYYYKVQVGNLSETAKMVLLK